MASGRDEVNCSIYKDKKCRLIRRRTEGLLSAFGFSGGRSKDIFGRDQMLHAAPSALLTWHVKTAGELPFLRGGPLGSSTRSAGPALISEADKIADFLPADDDL